MQERVPIGTALACENKGAATEKRPRHELAQWVDSCTCKIIREKSKVDSRTNRLDMFVAVCDQSDKLEFASMNKFWLKRQKQIKNSDLSL